MKRYLNNREYFNVQFDPNQYFQELNSKQSKFDIFIEGKRDLKVEGDVTKHELSMISRIKDEIKKLIEKHPNEDPAKLDFALAKIFHQNLKINRAQLNDWGFWRWLAINFFIEEIQWRWAKKYRDKMELNSSAVAVCDHIIGKSKNHRIFPRRLYVIGLRLYDGTYEVIDQIHQNILASNKGGFGDFINNLVDTKLLSFNDNVAKLMAKELLASKNVHGKEDVVASFKRFNGFKGRLMSDAPEEVFKREILNIK